MAGLSSNVMNMKFMQRAKDKSNEKKKEEDTKKARDASQWVLPGKHRLETKLQPAVTVTTVGYGSIAALTADDEEEKSIVEEKVRFPKL